MKKVKLGIVGTGLRGYKNFGKYLQSEGVKGKVMISGLCDTNEVRLKYARNQLDANIPIFTDYEEFLKIPELDGVIVTTPCYTHADLTIRALKAGKHVLCEKAMATTAKDCKRMIEAEKMSGKRMMLGLCLRYADFMKELIPILRRGDIGEVKVVSVVETLEGSSHFSRWHRKRELSGGILMQKGTHTFDLINWIVNEKPVAVSGFGGRNVFAARQECQGRRCLDCPEKTTCSMFRNIEDLYRKAEKEDGYIWDRCIFDPDADILDNAVTSIEYENGKRANYMISLFYGVEGIERKFTIIGTDGKIDVSRRREEIVVSKRHCKDKIHYKLQGHGEGKNSEVDDFLNTIVTGEKPVADSEAGLFSALVGLAAEEAIAENRIVYISELMGE